MDPQEEDTERETGPLLLTNQAEGTEEQDHLELDPDQTEMTQTEQLPVRVRTLTERGNVMFESNKSTLLKQLDLSISALTENIENLETQIPTSISSLENSEQNLKSNNDRFNLVLNQYTDFLFSSRTSESLEELEQLQKSTQIKQLKESVQHLFEELSTARDSLLDARSSSSKYSNKSSASVALRKRAEVEAARAKLHFAQIEADLKRKQSDIKIELDVINHQKTLAAVEAEANFLEEQNLVQTNLPREDIGTQERTKDYVNSLANVELESKAPGVVHSKPGTAEPNLTFANPSANNFLLHRNNVDSSAQYVAQYLSKKDVLKDRLYSFGGKYEHYIAWKDTFKSVMLEIGANAAEELDLLLRWTGSASKQITSIKSANSGNPALGLTRAWERLDTQYGSPERVELALRTKLNSFPRITFKDKMKLFELSDILSEIAAIKSNPQYEALLSYLDTAAGVNPTISKLPLALQNKWRDRALSHKRMANVLFPPFAFFCEFVHDMAVSLNDPSFDFDACNTQVNNRQQRHKEVTVAKTTTSEETEMYPCFLHKNRHPLEDCRTFKHKPFDERKQLLKQHGVCFKCCAGRHLCKDCTTVIKCKECGNTKHSTAMHIFKTANARNDGNNGGERPYEEERRNTEFRRPDFNVDSRCTEICRNIPGKSCAKIVLVNISKHNSSIPPLRTYAIIDDQSNYSLAKPELFDYFNVNNAATQYSLRSCGGKVTLSGRQAVGFQISSIDGFECLELPSVTECDMIPNNRNEIPTPSVAENHPHLASIAGSIPPLDNEAEILLLIGRDVIPAHYIMDQKLGTKDQPFAQKLNLGWVIVGECCLDGAHVPSEVNSMKTFIHKNGRPSLLEPCENAIEKETLFTTTEHDNKQGLSWEDKQFNTLMSKEMKRNVDGSWVAPLPFKETRSVLPNNRQYAAKRTSSFLSSLKKDSVKRQHTLAFMDDLFARKHAERAPSSNPSEETWYLPLFGVYHPKKKDKIRIVFDSSAKFGGLSLNDVLMTGPNLTNNLLGVLMRFRKGKVAVMADIEQMFYSFLVKPEHRNFLRFVWPENNNLEKKLVDYQMNVHVFGNSPSPAVATFGLYRTAEIAESVAGQDVKQFVKRNFYVDDALSSHNSDEEAIDLLKRTQNALQQFGNLRLHKICSNSRQILEAFNKEDLAKDLKNLDFDDTFPLQRSLGVVWNVESDTFTFCVAPDNNAFTRRGVLSTINGLYDPLGLAAAFTITGKLLLRESMAGQTDWDETLPIEFLERWRAWKESLDVLKYVQVPRVYSNTVEEDVLYRDLFVFSDASEKAVAAVAYLVTTDKNGNQQLSYILGKAKVAPKHGHTIPRLELCAAVLAVEVYEICRDEVDFNLRQVEFFTDSKVVLGYIYNEAKRFFVYVGNRIDRIRNSTKPKQWNYIPSALNPADDATRGVTAEELPKSKWLQGPIHLLNIKGETVGHEQQFPLILPEEDREVRCVKTEVSHDFNLGCQRFERFSAWTSVIRAVAFIKKQLEFKTTDLDKYDPITMRKESENLVIKSLQQEKFAEEILALKNNQALPRKSRIRNLSPFLDMDGILRVGGRLNNAPLEEQTVNPVIIPQHHLSMLLVRHFHEKTFHQGRHFTEGAIRSAGYWLIGCKRQVTSCIHSCYQCRRLRFKPENQRMADLPSDRLTPSPPFTNIGVDVFGPWQIITRRTRGGQANSKRWALMFTCLVVRAVHIELLEEMTSSCFINALRRFCAIRGEVKIIRSDCGTNFIGSTSDIKANVINVEDKPLKDFLVDSGINWVFNPPHSSHFGGAWERMIGLARRILDAMLADVKHLTHDVLLTLMAEVSSIINARPLTPVTDDPDLPYPLTPATLLTMKTEHTVKSFNIDDFDSKDLMKSEWKRVQHLANTFWLRWKKEYLPTLQTRRKWQDERKNFATGDIVLVRDKTVHRNDWPIGVIVKTHCSEDGRVRSVDIRLGRDRKIYTRPTSEIVGLLSKE